MMFMQFQIGFDMGIVLIKSILFSMLSVFTLMPGLLMLFSKAMERTRHRSFIPRIDRWGKFALKLRYVGVLSFATWDREGNPQVRNISAIHYEPDGIYFFTARGKDFCQELCLMGGYRSWAIPDTRR